MKYWVEVRDASKGLTCRGSEQDKTLPSAPRRHWTNLATGSSKFTKKKKMCMIILSYWVYSNWSSQWQLIHHSSREWQWHGAQMCLPCCLVQTSSTSNRKERKWCHVSQKSDHLNIRHLVMGGHSGFAPISVAQTPKAVLFLPPSEDNETGRSRDGRLSRDSCLGEHGDRNILSVRQN